MDIQELTDWVVEKGYDIYTASSQAEFKEKLEGCCQKNVASPNSADVTPLVKKVYGVEKKKLIPMLKKVFIEGGKCGRDFAYDFNIDDWIADNLKHD